MYELLSPANSFELSFFKKIPEVLFKEIFHPSQQNHP